jgi:hypothetical protein
MHFAPGGRPGGSLTPFGVCSRRVMAACVNVSARTRNAAILPATTPAGLKIRVSTVRFRPWPLLEPIEVQRLTETSGRPCRCPFLSIIPEIFPKPGYLVDSPYRATASEHVTWTSSPDNGPASTRTGGMGAVCWLSRDSRRRRGPPDSMARTADDERIHHPQLRRLRRTTPRSSGPAQ